MKIATLSALAATVSLLAACNHDIEGVSFADLAGSCTGVQSWTKGQNRGKTYDMAMELAPDGSYSWTREDGIAFSGRIFAQAGQLRYDEPGHSRGSVRRTADGVTLMDGEGRYNVVFGC